MYLSLLAMLIAQANGIIIPTYCWWIWGVTFVLSVIYNIKEKKEGEK